MSGGGRPGTRTDTGGAPDVTTDVTLPPPAQRVFCNRSLNMRSLRAIGYDMDYTLVHYHVEAWERRAYGYLRDKLAGRGWPVSDLEFEPEAVIRGLLIDRELGNLVKANRFGYVKRAAHGTRFLPQDEKKEVYGRTVVDADLERYVSLNTLFSLSEATMYAQLVDRLDSGDLPHTQATGYSDLYQVIRSSLDLAHMEGELKAEIVAHPDRYVDPDPTLPTTLLDQRQAGLRLAVITNSEWHYTRSMMEHVIDPYLPGTMGWRDLFDVVIVSARKPDFFHSEQLPIFEIIGEENGEGLLRRSPSGIAGNGAYVGGNARLLEAHFGIDGSEILYVGDHMYGDVRPSKGVRRWRTALILRELEQELDALDAFADEQRRLAELMARKERLEVTLSRRRLARQRIRAQEDGDDGREDELTREMTVLRDRIRTLDAEIGPLARSANTLVNRNWGPIMRTGKDKSALARHMEQHADLYTSRVSNFLHETPFAYFRAPYGSMPHDPGPGSRADGSQAEDRAANS